MEHLAKALEQALAQNKELAENSQKTTESLLKTIERMADGLTKASAETMAPIGKSCGKIALFNDNEMVPFVTADKALKEYFSREAESSIEESNTYTGMLTELDKVTGTCKITLSNDEDDARIAAEIWDPSFKLERENAYLTSFSKDQPITFTAKSQLDKNGNIVKFFISDAKVA